MTSFRQIVLEFTRRLFTLFGDRPVVFSPAQIEYAMGAVLNLLDQHSDVTKSLRAAFNYADQMPTEKGMIDLANMFRKTEFTESRLHLPLDDFEKVNPMFVLVAGKWIELVEWVKLYRDRSEEDGDRFLEPSVDPSDLPMPPDDSEDTFDIDHHGTKSSSSFGLIGIFASRVHWENPFTPCFEPALVGTPDEDTLRFTQLDGTKVRIPMMYGVTDAEVTTTSKYKRLSIPFEGRQLWLTIYLPKKGVPLDQVRLESRSGWTELETMQIWLPCFALSSEIDLRSIWAKFGTPCDETSSSFDPIVPGAELIHARMRSRLVVDYGTDRIGAAHDESLMGEMYHADGKLPDGPRIKIVRSFRFLIENHQGLIMQAGTFDGGPYRW